MELEAVLVGATVDAAVATFAALVALPAGARWPAFAAVAAAGLVGGHLAGRVAGGTFRRRLGHGVLAGLLGGAAFAVAVWWSLQPGAPNGALWPVNYLLATAGLPTDLAARYDVALGVAAATTCGLLYVLEGALAGGAAPGGDAEAVVLRE
ncbi:hypothetical protein NGM07_14040 [Halorussus vallis]|uniref:hypothetical protein n=1 Tax=Halorussus vallis TaxID=2953749 RepID=UPI00209CA224|nr:hypothetical protein [Halorussus vallis]USZ74558.1 hypothetical protein NGM07_14040 [Halorussus vallis]